MPLAGYAQDSENSRIGYERILTFNIAVAASSAADARAAASLSFKTPLSLENSSCMKGMLVVSTVTCGSPTNAKCNRELPLVVAWDHHRRSK